MLQPSGLRAAALAWLIASTDEISSGRMDEAIAGCHRSDKPAPGLVQIQSSAERLQSSRNSSLAGWRIG
ncbi:MAG: hypothetical protein O2892_17325 [Actinomycetota bacterium]|nr:hypothetical protein [Actinomycetota bacterium]